MDAPPVFTSPKKEDIERSAMTAFTRFFSEKRGVTITGEEELRQESLRDIAAFWTAFVEWSGLRLSGDTSCALSGADVETARFFPGASLSFVSHLLDPPQSVSSFPHRPETGPASLAVIGVDETGLREEVSRGDLQDRVRRLAAALVALGVRPGDRVVGLCRLTVRSLVACLGTLAIGAVWSSAAPDMGTELLLARAGQVAPKVLFADTSYPYHGTTRDNRERVLAIAGRLPSLEHLITFEDAAFDPSGPAPSVPVEPYSKLLETPPLTGPLPELPFNHPLYILFSSGTTGLPKCIEHGAGGTLVEHLKELRLHSDIGPGDRLLYHTTTGWMMFNWLVSGLATGAAIVLYDGSVSHPEPDALFRRVSELKVTAFGTSPTYLQYCRDAGIVPKSDLDLSCLRFLLSTGSVLFDTLFDWAGENIGPIPIFSISGGTDIVGCFVLGSPNRPVYRGESPSISLGLDVRAATPGSNGTEMLGVPREGSVTGELVCVQPFPSRPIGLFGDASGSRFHEAYFADNPGVWTHGDHIEITSRATARILGRSDGVLNVRGIRIGPGEIYRALEGIREISAACAVEQRAPQEPGGSRLVLLVVPTEKGTLSRSLILRIKKELSTKASAAHVPSVIIEVSALPRTHNGKLSERAARDAANGAPVKNRSALKNPEVLDEIESHPDIRAARSE